MLHRLAAPRWIRRSAISLYPNCPQIEEQMFERVLAQAASQNGRDLQIVQMCGAGPDHPVVPGFEKTKYLKFALCRLL